MVSPHSVLGVEPGVTEKQIRAAYFALARQFHPDVNQSPTATHKFKEIQESVSCRAYEKLTTQEEDPQNSSQEEWTSQGEHTGRGTYSYTQNEWEEFERWMYDFQSKVPRKGRDIHLSLSISLAQATKGFQRDLSFTRKSLCPVCHGHRSTSKTQFLRCSACSGYGKIRYRRSTVNCQKCYGTGMMVVNPCQNCAGEGLVERNVEETVDIHSGIHEGSKVRLKHKGHHSPSGGESGDLILTFKLKSDSVMRRSGLDIISKVYIPVAEAVIGTNIEVETVHGVKVVRVEPGIVHGTRLKIRGFGLRKGNVQGDHCVTLLLSLPKSLSSEELSLYQRLVTLGKANSR